LRLDRCEAAIDENGFAIDQIRRRRGEEQHEIGDLPRLTEAAERRAVMAAWSTYCEGGAGADVITLVRREISA
jgi:hypothetical protein